MIFILLAFVIGVILAYLAYTHIPAAPAQISQTVPAYDNQFEVFRDMEPADQTRENSWVGFLQENVRAGRTGPIGDFIGNDSSSGSANLYSFESRESQADAANSIPSCQKLKQDLSSLSPVAVNQLEQECENDLAKAANSATYKVTS